MARTLLIGSPKSSWRTWIAEHRAARELIVLDPSDASYGAPARAIRVSGDRIVDYRFIGSIDPKSNPLAVLQAATQLLAEDALILAPVYRPDPILRHLTTMIAQIVRPDEILVPDGAEIPSDAMPIGPQSVATESSFPEMVEVAQRRARWIEMLESTQEHEVHFDEVTLLGTRIGSGQRVRPGPLEKSGIHDILWAEKCGSTLLLVTKNPLDDDHAALALQLTHARRLVHVDPMQFSGRLCSFARQDGTDFGMGMIESLDFGVGVFRIRAVAVAPAPVRLLKIGTLVIDSSGREIQDDIPWRF